MIKADEKEASGLYNKYVIAKESGEPLDPDAEYFVLRIDSDPAARMALRYFCLYCAAELAAELQHLLERLDRELPLPPPPRRFPREPVDDLTIAGAWPHGIVETVSLPPALGVSSGIQEEGGLAHVGWKELKVEEQETPVPVCPTCLQLTLGEYQTLLIQLLWYYIGQDDDGELLSPNRRSLQEWACKLLVRDGYLTPDEHRPHGFRLLWTKEEHQQALEQHLGESESWTKVMERLGELYEEWATATRETVRGTLMDLVWRLMKAYDDWLD